VPIATDVRRGLECFLLFYVTPVTLAVLRWKTGLRLSLFVALFLVITLTLLWRDTSFDRRNFLRWEAVRRGWKAVALRFLVLAPVLGLLFALLKPAPAFAFPRERPFEWILFSFFFPVVPAFPEETLFRVYFLHRYRFLFPDPRVRMVASAASFSLAHLHLANGWALALSFVGGLLFAQTFERYRSAALTSFEHALWGVFIFTIGLGPYFHPALAR
jgi:uncharacterized protein